MITIRQYKDLTKAHLDKSLLEAAGIPVSLDDEYSTLIGYGSILGGVRLQVQDSDVDRARRVLDEREMFAPLPDDFIPPENRSQPEVGMEIMETSTKVVLGVVITLTAVFAMFVLFNPRNASNTESSSSVRREYEQRCKRADALLTAQEQNHQRYESMVAQTEKNQQRYEKILATWERQQEAYQKYLDSLKKKQ